MGVGRASDRAKPRNNLPVLTALLSALLVTASVVGAVAIVSPTGYPDAHRPVVRGLREAGVIAAHSDPNRFRRFRLGAIDGERISPNRDQLATRTVANGPLLLFLPATGAQPADYTQFLSAAANAGYHVLGLDYWNLGRTLSGMCGAASRCYTEVQRNRFDGGSPSRYSAVRRAGSIVSRLRSALQHLVREDPAGGWGRFLARDEVRWNEIVVTGHSQGGSQAAFIGHIRRVQGVLMFGAPAISHRDRHAGWLDTAGATPPSRVYALAHVDDEFGAYIRPSWRTLALHEAGRPYISRNTPPRGDPHVIETTIAVPEGRSSHSIVVRDRTPRDELGNPVLLPVWRWLLTRFDVPLTHPQPAPDAR